MSSLDDGGAAAHLFGLGASPAAVSSLKQLTAAIRAGTPAQMKHAGERGMVRDGKGCVFYITSSLEEDALAWSARHFAKRSALAGQVIDCASSLSHEGLTSANAKAIELALRNAISCGDASSMIEAAAHVEQTWPAFYHDVPKLRALTWATRVLGERCRDGAFSADDADGCGTAPPSPTSTPSHTPNSSNMPSNMPSRTPSFYSMSPALVRPYQAA